MVVVSDTRVRAIRPRHAAARPAGARIVAVEDDPGLLKVIGRKLRRNNFRFDAATSPLSPRELLDSFRPDLLLLDLDTAGPGGLELISEIRRQATVPIIVLSSRTDERDAVAALELGADDFLAKPFGLDELLARIRVGLRHSAKPERGADSVVRLGSLRLDIERRQVTRDGEPVHLTPTEYRLLKLFATHPNRFLADRWLIDEIWGPAWRGGEHILHVYVARLRKKVERDPTCPEYLLTESGLGYRVAADDH